MRIDETVSSVVVDVSMDVDDVTNAIKEYLENNWEGSPEGLDAVMETKNFRFHIDGRDFAGVSIRAST